ncbi:hypothetical protein IWW50_006333 [Coemansia erecta]|nr:hypothetical protein IWW50_006333 [Coemansia erecta]
MDVASLAPRIREILRPLDLSVAVVSGKKVRRQLENELDMSLVSFEAEINNIIKEQFQQLYDEQQQRRHTQQQCAMDNMHGAPQPSVSDSVAPKSPATTDADELVKPETEAKPEDESKPKKPEHEFKPADPESDLSNSEPAGQR